MNNWRDRETPLVVAMSKAMADPKMAEELLKKIDMEKFCREVDSRFGPKMEERTMKNRKTTIGGICIAISVVLYVVGNILAGHPVDVAAAAGQASSGLADANLAVLAQIVGALSGVLSTLYTTLAAADAKKGN